MTIEQQVSKRPGRVFTYISAAMYTVLGILFIINPVGMASGLGFDNLNKIAVNEVVASYGGLWLGIGILIYMLAKKNEMKIALYVVFFTFAGFALGRAIGAIKLGGFYGLHCYWLAFELTYLLITNFYIKKYKVQEELIA